jgi:hypothetical protein
MPEQSWSPGGALPEATPAQREEAGLGPPAPSEGTLDLGLVSAVIRDGLLMVFGPDGDPVPPQVFGAAAAEQPDAALRLADGAQVPAERVAAVLDAQIGGRLGGAGEDGDEPWIRAMLGLAPQPQMAESDDLLAERCTVELVALGRELMITSQHGATFLIADARLRTADSICVWVGSEGPVAPSDLVERLLAGAGENGAEAAHELALPECHAWLEDDALMLDLATVGPVYLARLDDAGVAAPAASMFMANGEVATIDHLLSALSGAVAPPATEQADFLPSPAPIEETDPLPPPAAVGHADSLHPPAAIEPVVSILPPTAIEEADPIPPPSAIDPLQASFATEQVDFLPASAAIGETDPLPAPTATEQADFLPSPAAIQQPDPLSPPAAIEYADPLPPSPPQLMPARPRPPVPLPIGLPDAFAAAPDRVVLVVVRGLPEGASLSAGAPGGDGSWLCSPRDLPGVSLTLPPAWASELAVEITAIAVVSPEGELARAADTVRVLAPCAAAAAPAPALEPASSVMVGPARAATPLELEAHLPSGAGLFDAWLVRDLPAGVTLSAGTYDPALDVWVLLPHQLPGLSMLTSGALPADFTLSLTGVSLHGDRGARPRLVARVPVGIARQSPAR